MPEENDWVLNSLAYDASLIRNYLSYDLARSTGNYAPRGVYCEVIINDDYKGLYVFMEKIKIDSARVNIVEMDEADNSTPDVTGGYIIKADKTTGGDPVAWTMDSYNGSTNYLHDNPNPFEVTTAQSNYIRSQFIEFQDMMDGQNASVVHGFPSIIDVPSFIDYMLISEITSNADSYQYSTFFHKDRNGKLRAGPVWDYDLTYGNDLFFWGLDRSHTDVWQFDNWDNTGSRFWKDLYDNSTFRCYLSKRWNELIAENQPLNYSVIVNKIDRISEHISEAAARENYRWGNSGNRMAEVANMKEWLKQRMIWMGSKLYNYNACADPEVPPLVISKINYHPVDDEGNNSLDREFIEISNNGEHVVDLTGIYFRELGLTYQFPPNSTVDPHEKIFLASNPEIFLKAYGFQPFDEFTRNLSNQSEILILADAFGNIIDSVRYKDLAPWPEEAGGNGYFLELSDLNSDNSLALNWSISSDLSTGVIDLFTDNKVQVFPNPAKTELFIEAENLIFKSCEVYNLNGRKMMEKHTIHSGLVLINIGNLFPDIYLLKMNCSNGRTFVSKFVKLPDY